MSSLFAGSEDSPYSNRGLAKRMDILEHNQRKMLLHLGALCEKQGINPSTIPGMNDPPPSRRSLSPSSHSIQSASSPGVAMSSLALSDAQSDISAHSSIASMSDVPGESHTSISTVLSHHSL